MAVSQAASSPLPTAVPPLPLSQTEGPGKVGPEVPDCGPHREAHGTTEAPSGQAEGPGCCLHEVAAGAEGVVAAPETPEEVLGHWGPLEAPETSPGEEEEEGVELLMLRIGLGYLRVLEFLHKRIEGYRFLQTG